jgi:hypothetical protein
VVKSELQLPPVGILVLGLEIEVLIIKLRQISDIEALQAGVEVPESGRNGLEVGQIGFQEGDIFFDDRIEYPRQIEHLHGHIIVDLPPLAPLGSTLLRNLEVDKEVLDLREGIDDLPQSRLGLLVVGHREFIGLEIPSLAGVLAAVEVDLRQGLLSLVINHIPSVNMQRAVEAVELNPDLLLQHPRSLLRIGEQS